MLHRLCHDIISSPSDDSMDSIEPRIVRLCANVAARTAIEVITIIASDQYLHRVGAWWHNVSYTYTASIILLLAQVIDARQPHHPKLALEAAPQALDTALGIFSDITDRLSSTGAAGISKRVEGRDALQEAAYRCQRNIQAFRSRLQALINQVNDFMFMQTGEAGDTSTTIDPNMAGVARADMASNFSRGMPVHISDAKHLLIVPLAPSGLSNELGVSDAFLASLLFDSGETHSMNPDRSPETYFQGQDSMGGAQQSNFADLWLSFSGMENVNHSPWTR